MSESIKWYRRGRCSECGGEIMRRFDFIGDSGKRISPVCSCSVYFPKMGKVMDGNNGVMVVW